MLRIKPFQAVRPHPPLAPRVASLPYDVVSTEEARALAADNPLSFLHVVRSEIDLPAGTNPYDAAVYERARQNLQRLQDDGALLREAEPAIYLYRQVMNHRAQVGVVCCCHIDDYLNNTIRKHEKTRQAKEDDRTRHVLTVNANTGPVFLTFTGLPELQSVISSDMNHRPLFHFDAPDHVTHTAWKVQNPQPYVDAFARLDRAYVADGHHRSASAARAGAERKAANPQHTGEEEYNWFLSVLFPAEQLTILPYNRIVRDLNSLSSDAFISQLRMRGSVSDTADPAPDRPGVFCFYLAGRWLRFELDPARIDRSDPIESLDVALLQSQVLEPLLGIGDIRSDERIDFVGGIRGTAALQRMVDAGEAALAVSMYPTGIAQLIAVSDADRIMPPKSTWFEPKLRSGLFIHMLD